jgi:hypothetical protein
MAPAIKILGNRRGQTSVEYLMLMAMAFITAYIIVTGPLATFTKGLFANLQEGIQNVITNAEWSPQEMPVGSKAHPTSKEHFKPMHL